MALKVYNSLSKKVEDFKPLNPDLVSMYTCGPTVYYFAHIGNFRTWVVSDFLHRVLKFNGYKVKYVMNITDVGHLTGDNTGDADTGEDRLEAAAEKEGRSAKDIANFYLDHFLKDYNRLNLQKPTKFTRATDYIQEQISLVKDLEKKGYTYTISDGVYFNTSKFRSYGKLSGMSEENMLEGARVEPNPEKKNPTDFALWKFSPQDKIRWQEWDSPWGVGFPGWHLECSAMSLKELGDTIDVHLGGEDLKMIHHQNEIAQSECSTGEEFVKYWMHTSFLQVDGGRMSKSGGTGYTVDDIIQKSFDPIALRYFYMTAHYRSPLNFTWEALQNVQNSLRKLYDIIGSYKENPHSVTNTEYMNKFMEAVNDDLNMPKAVAVLWELLKADVPEEEKVRTLLAYDEVLGLNLENYVGFEVPEQIMNLAKVRNEYRKAGIWDKADSVRKKVAEMGYVIEDNDSGFKVKRRV